MLLDANALFLPIRNGFPLESEIDRLVSGAVVAIPTSVLTELDRLRARGESGAPAARALAERFEVVPSTGTGDDAVVRAAVRLRARVVTADRGLSSRLTLRGLEVLVPRDRHRLEIHPARRRPRRRPNRLSGR